MRTGALSGLRRWRSRSRIATLALAAFLFQALLVSFHVPRAQAVDHDLIADLQVLCSVEANKSESAAPVSSDPDSRHHKSDLASSHCQICRHTQIAATYLPTTVGEVEVRSDSASPAVPPAEEPPLQVRRQLPQSPRAPPAVA